MKLGLLDLVTSVVGCASPEEPGGMHRAALREGFDDVHVEVGHGGAVWVFQIAQPAFGDRRRGPLDVGVVESVYTGQGDRLEPVEVVRFDDRTFALTLDFTPGVRRSEISELEVELRPMYGASGERLETPTFVRVDATYFTLLRRDALYDVVDLIAETFTATRERDLDDALRRADAGYRALYRSGRELTWARILAGRTHLAERWSLSRYGAEVEAAIIDAGVRDARNRTELLELLDGLNRDDWRSLSGTAEREVAGAIFELVDGGRTPTASVLDDAIGFGVTNDDIYDRSGPERILERNSSRFDRAACSASEAAGAAQTLYRSGDGDHGIYASFGAYHTARRRAVSRNCVSTGR